jgi:hypothetical protein
MNNSNAKYIVLAHLPKDYKADMAFAGDFRLHPTEWVIFTGVSAKRQAEAKARMYAEHFHEVQIREVSEILPVA